MANFWTTAMTSDMDIIQAEYRERMRKDNGLLKLGPNQSSGKAVTEARLEKILPALEKYYELWLAYPDKFMELLMPEDTSFKLLPFQKFALRANARHKVVVQAATRGFSKSFIAILGKVIQGILLPRSKLSVVSEFKQQATQIGREKINELKFLMPLLEEEIDTSHGSGKANSKDFLRVVLKNKSELDIVSLSDSTRGGRRHSILFEEYKDLPEQEVNATVLPLLNIARRTVLGELNENEPSQQQLYVGSCGSRHSFAYDKTIEALVTCAIDPRKAFVWGAGWKIPVYYGLLDREFVADQMNSTVYSEADFAREYESKWTSEVEGSLFSYDALEKLRIVSRAEHRREDRDGVFYILGVDVARSMARTVMEVFKVYEGEEYYRKKIVNIITIQGGSFVVQAEKIKELDSRFDFDKIVIDGNGLGVGLIDLLMPETVSSDGKSVYPAFGVDNIDEYPDYAQYQQPGAPRKIHIVKTNQSNAGHYHQSAFKQISSGRVKLLINEKIARQKLLATKKGRAMSVVERERFLQPYLNTRLLVEETSNIQIKKSSANFTIELIDGGKQKDTFSAMEYALGYLEKREGEYYAKKRKKRAKWSQAVFYT